MARLHFHGHATFSITTDEGTRLLIDPFFVGNPAADIGLDEIGAVDFVLCTHGHADHFGDALTICERTGAVLISSYEIVSYAATRGVENGHPMGIGGGYDFPFGRVKMTVALHGPSVAGDGAEGFSSTPCGFLISLPNKTLYFAGDTALTMDMQLLRGLVDIAVLPIGDNFTMGPEDATRAVEFVEPAVVVPFHYGTWDIIDQDPSRFASLVGDRAQVEILEPGAHYDF